MIRENGANLWYASTKFTLKPEAARKELCLANLTENYNEHSPKPWYQNRLRRKNVGGKKEDQASSSSAGMDTSSLVVLST